MAKNPNIKQKRYRNKFNKRFKMVTFLQRNLSVIVLSLSLAVLGLRGRFSSLAGVGPLSGGVAGLLVAVASPVGKHRLLVLWLQ